MKYELHANLLTGNSMIDLQHKELFRRINDLMQACSEGRGRAHIKTMYYFLENYIIDHFKDEEDLQEIVEFNEITFHKNTHLYIHKLCKKTGEDLIKEGATIKTLSGLNNLVSTLINHVKYEDNKIAVFIKEKNKEYESFKIICD